jgi:release factor glutamine methyltransferase
MQLREALRSALTSLQERNVPSPGLAAELLVMHVLGRDRAFLYTCPEFEIASHTAARYFELVAERATGKPTQYITGHQEFWGLDFGVTPDVLIPRPETEHLVEVVLELVRRDFRVGLGRGANGTSVQKPIEGRAAAAPRILDVGTGSGCIVLALASELPGAMMVATDISRPALEVARRNARRLNLANRVHFVEADLLNCFTAKGGEDAFYFVVSNPPYVSVDEIGSLQREVRDFEPRIALGGTGSGAEIYVSLFSQAVTVLQPGGYVAVEIGYNQSEAVLALLGDGWDSAEIHPDLAGIPRVVIARKQPSAASRQPSRGIQTGSNVMERPGTEN